MFKEQKSQTSEFVRDNIVKITDEKGDLYGTGFFISLNNNKYCITCHHCIYKLNSIKIQKDDKEYTANWIEEYSDMSKDFAVLNVDNSSIDSLSYNLQAMPELRVNLWGFSTEKLKTFPKGMPGQKGELSSEFFTFEWEEETFHGKNKWNKKPKISVNIFQYNGHFELGFSGAPICYEADNKVVGVFIAKDKESGYVLPIQTILDKFSVKTLNVTFENQDNSSYLEQGNQFHNIEEYKSAIMFYDKIISDPIYFYAIFNKALSLRKLQNYSEAIDWYDMAINIHPNDNLVLRGKALTLHYLNKDSEAIVWYDKALDISPHDVRSLSNKGVSLLQLSEYVEAKKCFEHAIAIDPNYVDAIEGLKQLNHLINKK